MNKICNKTVMDTSDPLIKFNEKGESDYHTNFAENILPEWTSILEESEKLDTIAAKIKESGQGRSFDCIIGLSGGLDSSYTAYVAKEIMGLRPLLYHVDAGWNTDKAVKNIESLCDYLGCDLYTDVINWEEMRDLQVSFLKSGIPDQDMPQDVAFFSSLYKFARKHGIKYVLTGGNYSTECCREPEAWGAYPGIDSRLIKGIHKRFGTIPLRTFPIVDVFRYRIIYRYFFGMKVFKPLNYVEYNKVKAEELLGKLCGWQSFKHKHHESRFTRFYEDYWLKNKFGYDKRKAHFSSLILTGQMSRSEALKRLEHSEMTTEFLEKEFIYVADKLDLSVSELRTLFKQSNQHFSQYPNRYSFIKLLSRLAITVGIEKRLFR